MSEPQPSKNSTAHSARFLSPSKEKIIIYNAVDGKASVSLYAKDGLIWMNQNQLAGLFATTKQNIGQHVENILEDKELDANSVVTNYFTTASDGKDYNVRYYALDMVRQAHQPKRQRSLSLSKGMLK